MNGIKAYYYEVNLSATSESDRYLDPVPIHRPSAKYPQLVAEPQWEIVNNTGSEPNQFTCNLIDTAMDFDPLYGSIIRVWKGADDITTAKPIFGGLLTAQSRTPNGLGYNLSLTASGWVRQLENARLNRRTYYPGSTYFDIIANPERSLNGLNPPGIFFDPKIRELVSDYILFRDANGETDPSKSTVLDADGNPINTLIDSIRVTFDGNTEWQGESIFTIVNELANGNDANIAVWIDADKAFHFKLANNLEDSGYIYGDNAPLKAIEYSGNINGLGNDILFVGSGGLDTGQTQTVPRKNAHNANLGTAFRAPADQETPTFRYNTAADAGDEPVWTAMTAAIDRGQPFSDVDVDLLWDSATNTVRVDPTKITLNDYEDSLEVTGTVLTPQALIATNPDSIRAYGRWMTTVHDNSVIGRDRLRLVLTGKLTDSSQNAFKIYFEDEQEIGVGQLITLDTRFLPRTERFSKYVVQSVTIKPKVDGDRRGLIYGYSLGKPSNTIRIGG